MLIKRTLSFVLALVMVCAFSISAFAGYDFSEDGNTNRTEYNGNNSVYSNGIYVGTDPVTGLPLYKFEMDNIENTYNGNTTIHGNGDALFNGYDTYGTYNGDLDVVGTDVGSGTLTTINGATINADTSISAADAISDNDINAGVLIKDSTFTNDVTVQSSTVYLDENANVILGSTQDMNDLISEVQTTNTKLTSLNTLLSGWTNPIKYITGLLMFLKDNLAYVRYTTDSNARNITVNNTYDQANYILGSLPTYSYSVVDQHINRTITYGYGNFRAILHYRLIELQDLFYAYAELFSNWFYPLRVTSPLYWKTYNSDTNQEESVNLARVFYDISYYTGHIMLSLDDFRDEFQVYKTSWFSLFNTWNNHWRDITLKIARLVDNLTVYRSSSTQDVINLSVGTITGSYTLTELTMQSPSYNKNTGKFEFVSTTSYCNTLGYLANSINRTKTYLYAFMQYLNDQSPATNITQSVSTLNSNLTTYTNAEQTIQNKVTSSLQSFVPDINLLSGFVAISWVSNYLQQVYISLGTFGTVIMIGLLLGVCMQFIGYFRYKY